MKNGVVEQVGPPLELYDRPNNTFVATFIGSPAMNILEGRIAKGVFTIDDGQTIKLEKNQIGSTPRLDVSAKLGIRPEHISVSTDPKLTGLNAVVESVETTGAVTYVCCKIAQGFVNAVISERLDLEIGQKVKLAFSTGRTHLFDAGTGNRLI
jgi:multiple sugar transport system ATP-binding protein